MSEPIEKTVTESETLEKPTAKTFTQEEVDALITRRVARAMKGMPDDAELAAFRTWKADQQTEQERITTLTQERDTAQAALTEALAKIEQHNREAYLLSKGVSADDVDYYSFKISKNVTDETTFEAAADAYLKDNAAQKVRVNLTGALGGGSAPLTANDAMNTILRKARK